MSASAALVTRIPSAAWAIAFGALLIGVEVFASYRLFAEIVKWLCLTLLAYIASAFVVGVNWFEALRHTFIPEMRFDKIWMATFVGFLGTTITPYLFVWQAALEVEEERAGSHRPSLSGAVRPRPRWPACVRTSSPACSTRTASRGSSCSSARRRSSATHYDQHREDAARALRPLAGPWAELLFALGVVGAGLLAVPVLAGSSAFALAEALDWKGELDAKPRRPSRSTA